mgnify:CR=1 FL=1
MTDTISNNLIQIAGWTTLFIIVVGLLQNLIYLIQLALAARELTTNPPVRRLALLWKRYADLAPPIALLSPAYNEELTIVDSVRSMLALEYPTFEVVVINDGSKDNTMQTLKDAFGLQPLARAFPTDIDHKPIRGIYGAPGIPRLIVVDKENGGKADALNAGINVSRSPVFCSMDADSILESDSLIRAVSPFVDDPAHVIAVGGTVRLANGCDIEDGRVTGVRMPRNPLALFQVVEYLRAFLMARLAWSKLGTLTIISGAFGLFLRSAVIKVGGYSRNTVGEDMELVIKLHKYCRQAKRPYRIAYVPEPVCWTEAPETLKVLKRQRARWHRGSLETFFKHIDMFMNPRYGRVGVVGFGNIFFVDVLGPLVVVLGYLLIPVFWFSGLLSLEYLLAFLAVSFTFGISVSVCSLALEEVQLKRFPRAHHLLLLTVVAILENFGYRQLNNFWRILGTWQFLKGSESWGDMTRKGFKTTSKKA